MAEVGGRRGLLLEFVQERLPQFFKTVPVTDDTVKFVGRQAASALCHLHGRNIVHRCQAS